MTFYAVIETGALGSCNIYLPLNEWNDTQAELTRLRDENALLRRNVARALTYLMTVKQALFDDGEMDIAQEQGGR